MTMTTIRKASILHYPAHPVIVGMARNQAISLIQKWSLPVALDDAALIVSELATNAVRISKPADQVALHLRQVDLGLAIGVWDSFQSPPIASTAGELTLDDTVPDPEALAHDDRAGGWGLPLVQTLAAEFQVMLTSKPTGKWVTALLPATTKALKDATHGAA